MAMGREGDVQGDLMMTWAEMPRSPGHAFYDRLQVAFGRGRLRRFRRGDVLCMPRFRLGPV
jgi:hypothetical protein